MSYESFNIRPGMSTWVDMPESYKNAYREKFNTIPDTPMPEQPLLPGESEEPVADEEADWRSPEEEVEDNEVAPDEEADWRSQPTVTFSEEEVIDLVEEVENPCPVCGGELPKGKKYCTRRCFYDRNK